jgi:hypothetical protein
VKRLFASLLLLALHCQAEPASVILIRHGEKPEGKADPHLTAAGRARAARWVGYFTNSPSPVPDVLLAPLPTKQHASVRPIETLEPLAKSLHLPISTPFASGDYAKLAQQLLTDPQFAGKNVAVCWVHQSLPPFAAALGVDHEPPPWKDADYGGVYRITFVNGKARLSVSHTD